VRFGENKQLKAKEEKGELASNWAGASKVSYLNWHETGFDQIDGE